VRVDGQLLVRPQVEQAARGVVRARGERVAVGEELNTEGGPAKRARKVKYSRVSM